MNGSGAHRYHTCVGYAIPLHTLNPRADCDTSGLSQQIKKFLCGIGTHQGHIHRTSPGSNYDCGAHEGYSGWKCSDLAGVIKKSASTFQPDVVLLQCGTNDMYFEKPFVPARPVKEDPFPQEVVRRMNTLLGNLFEAAPNATVLLSSVTAINATRCAHYVYGACPEGMNERISAFNKLLPHGVVGVWNSQSKVYSSVPFKVIFLKSEAEFSTI